MTSTTTAPNKGIRGGSSVRREILERDRYRLFPIGRDDRVVVAEDQIEPVWIVRDASDAARRYDPPQHLGEILLANYPLLAGLRLTAFDKLLADAGLTVVDIDLSLVRARHLLD